MCDINRLCTLCGKHDTEDLSSISLSKTLGKLSYKEFL